MGYDRIETFVKNEEKPYEYCLDFEYGNSAYEALNPIERYLAYKSTGVRVDKDKQNLSNAENFCLHSLNTYGDIPDCDGSDGRNVLTLDVYKKLWNWEKGYYSSGVISTPNFQGEFGGDTMNSMQTTFNALMGYALSKSENSNLRQYQKNNYSFMDCLQIYCNYPKELLFELQKESDFIRFADLYHTIGNMVLVPRRFNSGRYGKTFDFWDSSLVWLKNDGFAYGNQLLFDKRNFTKYINYFYLWDYVESVNGEYRVKPLFNSHSNIENGNVNNSLPWTNISNEQDLKKFLKNACENISKRGFFMSILMGLRSADNPKLKEISDEYFNIIQGDFLNNVHMDGYNDAVTILLRLLENFDDKNDKDYKLLSDGIMSLYKRNGNSDRESISKSVAHNFNQKEKTQNKKNNDKTKKKDSVFHNIKHRIKLRIEKFKTAPLDSICNILFLSVLAFSVGYGVFLYIRYLVSGGYDSIAGAEYLPIKFYGGNILNILFIIDLIGFLLLCVSFAIREKKAKKVIMIIALTCIAVLCVLCSLIPIVAASLEYNRAFMQWFNGDTVNNGYMINYLIDAFAKILLICASVIAILPLILMLFIKHYRHYLKVFGLSLLSFLIIVPLILNIMQIKWVAVILVIAFVIAAIAYVFSEIHTIIKYRCPACKKIDALMITRKLINEEDISIKVQLENRNNSGEIVGHSEQYIPGVRKTYEITYECKFCGYINKELEKEDCKKI